RVGADWVTGSRIKTPGGPWAPRGGYVAGGVVLVGAAACRLTAPGIGREGGATFDLNRLLFQGLFLAPQIVGEAVKNAHLAAWVFDHLGYPVMPAPFTPRTDVIQAIQLGSRDKLIQFCRAVQTWSPIDAYVTPVPEAMPGYADAVVMAGGTFIEGSTLELSADGPLRDPYTVYVQGGCHLSHGVLALSAVLGGIGSLASIQSDFD
ncbi:MAG: methionine gamma-lyase family protein, partial [Thermostichales cyanobacterium SRBZ-1_bins_19]